jgi:hypothetical protein
MAPEADEEDVAPVGRQSFVRTLKHAIEVPAGPGTRPGERVRAPNPSLHPPWPLGPDGSRADFRFLLSRRGSSFGAVCLGPVSDRGEPSEAAKESIQKHVQRGWEAAGLDSVSIAGDPASRTRVRYPRSVLTDWLFAHDGWLFAAGVLCRSGDRESVVVERAEAVLATWQWIEPPADPGGASALWYTRDSVPPPTE